MQREIRVVLWDIDNTILDFLAAERAAIRKGFARLGLGECTDEMLAEYSDINRKYWEMLERGEIDKPRVLAGRFEEFFSNHGIPLDIVDAFNGHYQRDLAETICFFDNAYALLESLKGKVRQCAVTNGTKIAQTAKLRNSGLDRIFDDIFISEDVGAEKPSKEYFDKVFSAIGPVDKDEVLIVGDSLTSDMRGGNNAGILCCWYNPRHLENDQGLKLDYIIDDLNEVRGILDGTVPPVKEDEK